MFYPPNFHLGIEDCVAILVFGLSILVMLFNLKLFKKYKGSKLRWHFIFSSFASLFMGSQYLLAAFDMWGPGGKPNLYVGRVAVVLLLTAIGINSTFIYKRE